MEPNEHTNTDTPDHTNSTPVTPENLVGNPEALPQRHVVLETDATTWPEDAEVFIAAAGCFWGVEKLLWQAEGVYTTVPGYVGGFTEHPDYRSVCSGQTGHTEGVLVVFDPTHTSFEQLYQLVLENHDPTQGNRQGNDIGTQYRSAVFPLNERQLHTATDLLERYGKRLSAAGYGPITTEVTELQHTPTGKFWVAEDYHQGYLRKNPGGYCPIHATGISCG